MVSEQCNKYPSLLFNHWSKEVVKDFYSLTGVNVAWAGFPTKSKKPAQARVNVCVLVNHPSVILKEPTIALTHFKSMSFRKFFSACASSYGQLFRIFQLQVVNLFLIMQIFRTGNTFMGAAIFLFLGDKWITRNWFWYSVWRFINIRICSSVERKGACFLTCLCVWYFSLTSTAYYLC